MTSAPIPGADDRRRMESQFAGAGLFVFAYALVQAGLIFWFRGVQSGLYLPPRLLVLSISLIAATAFAPFLAPDRWRARIGPRFYIYPLVSLAVLALAYAAFLPGGLAPLLVYLYAALGLAGLARALPRLRPITRRHLALPVLAVVFGIYVFYYFNQWNYAGVFAPEYALLGRVRKDTYFATVIAHMIQNYGVSSTGLDGLVPLHYHVGSHAWFAGLGKIAGTMPLLTYPFIHPIVLIPAQLLALLFSIICAAGARRSTATYVAAALAMVFFTDALGRPSHYVSESYAAGLTALLFFWPLMLDLLRTPERGRLEDRARLVAALGAVFVISALKISAGMIWTTALGWMLLRQNRFRPRGLILAALAGGLMLRSLMMFSDPGQAAIFAPLKFFRHNSIPLLLTCWIIPGMFLAARAINEKLYCRAALTQAVKEQRTLGAEMIVLMAVVGALPATLLWLSIGWSWFFFNLTQWPAMSMLVAEWNFKLPEPAGRRRFALGLAAAGLALYCAVGVWFLSTGISTGYLHGTAEFAGRQPSASALWSGTPERPYGTGLDQRLASVPGYQAYCLIMDAARGHGPGLAVHVPAFNVKFWNIVRNCTAEPMFEPAVTGVPMLYGLLPPGYKNCNLAFYGYPDYGADAFARDLDPVALCVQARSRGFNRVFELNDLDQLDRNQVIDCGPKQ